MKFSTREDISAPIDSVWETVTDFRSFERRALRNGIEVARKADDQAGLGAGWTLGFDFRGARRMLETEVTGCEPPNTLEFTGHVGGLDTVLTVELVALSQNVTRVMIGLEVKPTTLASRVMVQTAKLAKGKLDNRFKKQVGKYVKQIAAA
ncbi:SRPBCC family protein [Aliiruegeria sabulilitoris]|uniref:SRPBCC family protein n=1 Tax=Aliiruegeria sabulilitoris TaxID=1510458 RepID=UPI000830F9E0|nr:SRPBCC family protein [Aliiruegeria sabulilitoris]NDR57089.1 SRPBCC family protein [Pseudoruegeria sp. M32A2M]